jgi:hypothetical protein
MNLQKQIHELYEQYRSLLEPYLWASEDDRWAEFVFCLLHQCYDDDPDSVRLAVAMLQDLNLLEVNRLLCLNDPTHQNTITLTYILKQYGFPDAAARRSIKVLYDAAKIVRTHFSGRIQRYLRQHGQTMRDELVSVFNGVNLPKGQLKYAVTHWLQNGLSLPISLESKAVREFCQKNKVSMDDLAKACDTLGINLAIVDDILELSKNYNAGISGELSDGGG